ncbi:hypothetical protein V6N12_010618 [Hibiscus sabdariffa]|uniref:Bulb-type lectin domain-containing protein n=1 Tax=Hibiscus sabdariffa TaxID=183260 RepID=A0ABR2EKM2_9ROSI
MKTNNINPSCFMFMFLTLFMCLFLESNVCFALDTISTNQSLSDGNLVLFNESQVPIWSTNVSSDSAISSSGVAVLSDDGNLVLPSTILWQSFDHPTDTWLPGSKLRFNKRINQSRPIISWKSPDDPTPDLFTLEIDPVGANQIIIVWNMSRPYRFSGPWDQQTMSFSLVPKMRKAYLSNSNYTSNMFQKRMRVISFIIFIILLL